MPPTVRSNPNLQLGGTKVGAALTRVNSVYMGIFG
jgi:hypothetical protein